MTRNFFEKDNDEREWKNKNERYLKELQLFLDLADNIPNEKLRKNIIFQMIKCDEVLTQIAENNMHINS